MRKIKSMFPAIFACLCCLLVFGCGGDMKNSEYPKVTILQPGKSHYLPGEPVTFEGYGEDAYYNAPAGELGEWTKEKITGSQLVWTSSIDGVIGIGDGEFKIYTLSVGEHVITLTGVGYNDIKSSSSVVLIIEDTH